MAINVHYNTHYGTIRTYLQKSGVPKNLAYLKIWHRQKSSMSDYLSRQKPRQKLLQLFNKILTKKY